MIPKLDAIAEFRITTSNYGADVGKRSGATIEVVTKSGTKDLHGTELHLQLAVFPKRLQPLSEEWLKGLAIQWHYQLLERYSGELRLLGERL